MRMSFESAYLAEDWDNGSFHAGAGEICGTQIIPECDESLIRSIKRFMAIVEHFFGRAVHDIHAYAPWYSFSFDKISRGVADQCGQIIAHHVHRDTLEKALAYCRQNGM
jgi:hypothetical protein